MVSDMTDLFEILEPPALTVQLYMKLQEQYNHASDSMSPEEMISYRNRVRLRLTILHDFATIHHLPIDLTRVKEAAPDIPFPLLENIYPAIADSDREASPFSKTEEKKVILFNGGPASGKSAMMKELDLPEDTLFLDRDAIFPHLLPYQRLQKEQTDDAVHCVVTEAIMYNERDAYRLALQSKHPVIVVDGTMSYRDLGEEMILIAQDYGYKVHVINTDVDLGTALARAQKRAIKKHKAINHKRLYESHVRCAANFFHYLKLADYTENWDRSGEKGQAFQFACSKKILSNEVDAHLQEQDNKSFKIQTLPQGNHVIIHTIKDSATYQRFQKKSQLPLHEPDWPENYQELLV